MRLEMVDEISFRKAAPSDALAIWKIILQAKVQMKRLGSRQWDETYPAYENILNDICCGEGYVMVHNDEVVAYGVISFNSEPAYDNISGSWLKPGADYVVLHRLAVSDNYKRMGCARQFFAFAEKCAVEKGSDAFRVDTNYDNTYMLSLLESLGFVFCGKVYYSRGERLAYEKLF